MKEAIDALERKYDQELSLAQQWLEVYVTSPTEGSMVRCRTHADRAAATRADIEYLHRLTPGPDRPYFKE